MSNQLAAHAHGTRTDPTRTKTLRNRWSSEVGRRFRELRGLLRTALIDKDVFGLRDTGGGRTPADIIGGNRARTSAHLAAQQFSAPSTGQFDFPSDAQKVDAFMDWLDEQEQRGIIEIARNPAVGVQGTTSQWQNAYVRNAYSKGVTHADAALQQAGVPVDEAVLDDLFRHPMHAEALGTAYSRAYHELDGITNAMDQQLSRTLTTGLSQGHGPRRLARDINDRVDNVGRHRANVLARTEAINTHNEAALNRYEQMGVTEVQGLAEFRTAGDSRVCPECASMEGMRVSTSDARGIIPVHPRCRCTWLPVVNS